LFRVDENSASKFLIKSSSREMSSGRVYDHSARLVVERASIRNDDSGGEYVHLLTREEMGSPTGEPIDSDEEAELGEGIGTAGHGEGRIRNEDQGHNQQADEPPETTAHELITSSTSGSRACEVCNNLYMKPGEFYSTDSLKLKSSAAGGCIPCCILDWGFRYFDTEWKSQTQRYPIIFAPTQTAFQVSVSRSTLDVSDTDCLDFYTLLEGTALLSIPTSLAKLLIPQYRPTFALGKVWSLPAFGGVLRHITTIAIG
jgi:hypothetical protein